VSGHVFRDIPGAVQRFVAIPFKERVGWGWCCSLCSSFQRKLESSFCSGFSAFAKTDSHPCGFVPHPCGPVSFSCLSKSLSTRFRKQPSVACRTVGIHASPSAASGRLRPSRPRSRAHPARATARARSGVCRQRIPALTANSARSIAPTLRAFSTRARRGQEGTWKSQSAAFLAAEAKAFRLARRSGFSRDASALRGIAKKSIAAEAAPTTAALASARRSALLSAFPGPFSGGERRTTKPAGARARCARVRRQRTDALSANLGRRSRTFRAGCAEGDDAGLPFLLVPFLWASKEKKPAHRDAGRTRMDASRFSRKRKNPKQKLDSSLRWNDEHKEQHHPHPTLPLKGRAKAHGYQWFFARTLKNTMDSGLRWNDDIKTHRGAPR